MAIFRIRSYDKSTQWFVYILPHSFCRHFARAQISPVGTLMISIVSRLVDTYRQRENSTAGRYSSENFCIWFLNLFVIWLLQMHVICTCITKFVQNVSKMHHFENQGMNCMRNNFWRREVIFLQGKLWIFIFKFFLVVSGAHSKWPISYPLSTSISKNHAISRKIDLWGSSNVDEIWRK